MLDLNALQHDHDHLQRVCNLPQMPLAELNALMDETREDPGRMGICDSWQDDDTLLESRDVSAKSGCIYIERTHHDRVLGSEEEVSFGEEWA